MLAAIKGYKTGPVPKAPADNAKIDKPCIEDDTVITETGTSVFGIDQAHFPDGTYGISQVLWGSIGFTMGSTLGAAFAAEELDPKKRVILFIGDGSLQLTVREISTMGRWVLKPYLFVLNHDVNLQLLPTFGATDYQTHRVATVGEWKKLTKDAKFSENSKIRMVEIMPKVMDAPSSLVAQAKFTAAINAKL
ncbi:uncharacterized protein ZBAI_05039 [Zygosaccharomyces bailii ISA1307]|nr:uncharacterized protein ZBAI_05039 [Zygosaccharomyces bailii ISA1307]